MAIIQSTHWYSYYVYNKYTTYILNRLFISIFIY